MRRPHGMTHKQFYARQRLHERIMTTLVAGILIALISVVLIHQ